MAQSGVDPNGSNFATVWTVNNPPYAILKWSIENFSSAQNLVRSSCFDISETSKWNLIMDPSVVVNEDAFVEFYLKRNTMCPPARLRIKGEFSVHGPRNELIFDELFEEEYDSSSDRNISFRIAKLCFSVMSSRCDGPDTYLARCEMIISEELNSTDDWRPHLQKLSSDFQRLYQEDKFTNVTLRASDDIIHAHKAVLSARSLVLSEMLDSSGNILSQNDKNAFLGAVLFFIYTGNPDLLLTSFPLEVFGSVCSIAARWKLNELENILTPVKMHCRTLIKYEDFLYTWQLKNFSKLRCDGRGCIHSSEFKTNDSTDTKWKLIFEKTPQETTEAYGLYLAKLHPDNVSHKVDVEFRMYNRKSKCAVTKRREFTFGPRNIQKSGFSSFSNKGHLRSRVLKDDILNIDCRMKFRLDSESWVHFQAKFIDLSDEDPYSMKYLKTLSRNFKDLYESEKWSDLTLHATDGRLLAHRAIMRARSPYLSAMLSHGSEEYINVLIERSILREILLYMYSAVIPPLNRQNCLKFYKGCHLLQLMELWHVCRQYILLNINVDIVLEVIAMAHEYSDSHLENVSIEFASIPGNARMILDTAKWRNFRENYTDIAIRIYHNLAWPYCNHVCIR